MEHIFENHKSGKRFEDITTSNRDTIKKILELKPPSEDGTKATSKVRKIFELCLQDYKTKPTDEYMKSEIERAGGWRWIGDNSSLNFQQRVSN